MATDHRMRVRFLSGVLIVEAFSSAGLEHQSYKLGVVSSNLTGPTNIHIWCNGSNGVGARPDAHSWVKGCICWYIAAGGGSNPPM